MTWSVTLLAVAAVLIVVFVAWLSPRLGVATPILLVLVGMACTLIPGAPVVEIEPDYILTLVLPPLLYSAAVSVPLRDFSRNKGAIAWLSVVLVVVSALGTGALLWWIFPDLTFAGGVALGAVISPPDAIAATAIGKRAGLAPRLISVLEGESLVNDATALVLLRTAIAATAGAVSFGGVLGQFAWAIAGGVLIGLVVGAASVWVRSKVDQPSLTTAISFVVPFVAYFPAEAARASGVLAVVVAGLVTGHESVRRFSAQDRLSERINWHTVSLLLENGVFLVMGYQLTTLVHDVTQRGESVWFAVAIGIACTVVLLVIRSGFIVPLVLMASHEQARAGQLSGRLTHALDRVDDMDDTMSGRKQRLSTWLRRKQADAEFFERQDLGWRGGAVLAWSGMRGVVTLAAAQSLPTSIPYRAQLILIAFTVAIVTLLVHGTTLPWVIARLGAGGDTREARLAELAALMTDVTDATSAFLNDPDLRRGNGKPFDPEVLGSARVRAERFGHTMLSGDADGPFAQRWELRRRLLETQEAALLEARAIGTYSSDVISIAQRYLDEELSRLSYRGEGGD